MKKRGYIYFVLLLVMLMSQGCIHEYPHPVKGSSSDKGEDPTVTDAYIEVVYDLSWQNIMHQIEFSTKAGQRSERPHRFVIEVIDEDGKVVQETETLSQNEFAAGKMSHKLKEPLSPGFYRISVWYDLENEDNEYQFKAESLSEISLNAFITTDAESYQCAYASGELDLREYRDADEGYVVKQLALNHAGARFELIATDIQQFILNNKAALNQGDTFTANVSITGGVGETFNSYSGSIYMKSNTLDLSGRMRLPFAEYEELKIAEGFVFSEVENEMTLRLTVINSALQPVCQTEYFTIPVKRGYITTVRGDFLTNSINGVFSIDNIWEGEIVVEI